MLHPSAPTSSADTVNLTHRSSSNSAIRDAPHQPKKDLSTLFPVGSRRRWIHATGPNRHGVEPPGITSDTMMNMAMTLRLTDDETRSLRLRAELEGRPMQEVARQAIREYVEGHSRAELLDRVLDSELPRYAEALERLGH